MPCSVNYKNYPILNTYPLLSLGWEWRQKRYYSNWDGSDRVANWNSLYYQEYSFRRTLDTLLRNTSCSSFAQASSRGKKWFNLFCKQFLGLSFYVKEQAGIGITSFCKIYFFQFFTFLILSHCIQALLSECFRSLNFLIWVIFSVFDPS